MNRGATILCALLIALPAGANNGSREWNFRVLLDGKEIGEHRFALRDEGDHRRLESNATFDVRFLFFTAYRYRHHAVEKWRDGCLEALQAETVTNGKEIAVSGTRRDGAFVVGLGNDARRLPDCVMTFAYWNPRFLEQPKLLNPQTGEYLDVEVEHLPSETLTVGGQQWETNRFRVTAKDIELELWYSKDNRWLALESAAKGGRTIRYELNG